MQKKNLEVQKTKTYFFYLEKCLSFILELAGRLRSGVKLASLQLLFFYFLLYTLDILTTFLATPDLKYEGNILIRYFQLNWTQILFGYTIHAIIVIILFSFSLNYIHSYYRINDQKDQKTFFYEIFHRWKLLLSFIMFVYFFTQLFYTFYIVINNYLSYIFIFKIENSFTGISNWYLNIQALTDPYFFPVSRTIFIILTILFTIFHGNRIKKRYQSSYYN